MIRPDFMTMDDRLWTPEEWARWLRYVEASDRSRERVETGQKLTPKVYELVERQTKKPAIKADMSPLIHLYGNFAMCSNGAETLRVELTEEQIIQLAADANELAARILKSRLAEASCVCRKADKNAADRGVPGAGQGR
jgi:hypothetical protein